MLADEIKKRMFQAMKAGNVIEKEILRVALGEITTQAARGDKPQTDEEVEAILKKLVKSNQETLASSEDAEQKKTLAEEVAILQAFLPKSLGVDEIVAALQAVADAIKAAGNDGQATGIAMKHLKPTGAVVNGKDVSEAVKKIRS
jgi:uncharacterized protein YqeY